MSSLNLKPCPHCGETRLLYPSHHLNRMTGKVSEKPYGVDCVECGYEFVPRAGMDVVAMWNRRFDPTDLTAMAGLQERETDARLTNEHYTSILKEAMEELGVTDDFKIVEAIAANQALIAKLTEALERIYEECNNDGKWERMIERIELEAVSALSLAKSETPQ